MPRATLVVVDREKPIRISGRRYVPDLAVRCATSGRLLLLIEVWHTHAVSDRKRRAFAAGGFCWIEVKLWRVLGRHRNRPLPVIDWGGAGLPEAPDQGQLFPAEKPSGPPHRCLFPPDMRLTVIYGHSSGRSHPLSPQKHDSGTSNWQRNQFAASGSLART